MTKLRWNVKIKLTQDDEPSKICGSFLVIRCKPICPVGVSIFAPSKLVLSLGTN